MEPFKFNSTTGQTVGAYDCGSDFQNLVCLWMDIPEHDIVDDAVKKGSSHVSGILLTPNEARVLGQKLLDLADFGDQNEPKGNG